MLRTLSPASWEMICIDFSLRSSRAREVTISATYRPAGAGLSANSANCSTGSPAAPASRHSRRNGAFVTPAMGASTTGVPTAIGPICNPLTCPLLQPPCPRGAHRDRRTSARAARPREGVVVVARTAFWRPQPHLRRPEGGPSGAARRAGPSRHRPKARAPTGSGADQPRREVGLDLVQGNPLLAHRVPLTNGDRLVIEGVEVHGHAVGRADLVLTAIAPADRTGVVELDVPVLAQLGGQVLGDRGEFFVARERQHRGFDRSDAVVQPQHRALVHPALGVGGL